jgi:hypothetical protein
MFPLAGCFLPQDRPEPGSIFRNLSRRATLSRRGGSRRSVLELVAWVRLQGVVRSHRAGAFVEFGQSDGGRSHRASRCTIPHYRRGPAAERPPERRDRDFWGKNRSALQAAEEDAIASRFERDVVELSTIAATANGYFQLLVAQDRFAGRQRQSPKRRARSGHRTVKSRRGDSIGARFGSATERRRYPTCRHSSLEQTVVGPGDQNGVAVGHAVIPPQVARSRVRLAWTRGEPSGSVAVFLAATDRRGEKLAQDSGRRIGAALRAFRACACDRGSRGSLRCYRLVLERPIGSGAGSRPSS